MKKSFIFITKSQLNFYGSNLPAVAVLDLPPAIFQDMEIMNEEEFSKTVKTFIETHKIEPSEYIQILNSDLVIEKDISLQTESSPALATQPQETTGQPPTPPVKEEPKNHIKSEEKIQQEINDFLNIVPFENTLQFINRKDKKGIKVYVANKDIFQTLKSIFDGKGFISQGITAMPLLGENPVTTLDPHAAKNLLSRYDTLKNRQFTIATEIIKNDADESFLEEEKPESSHNAPMIIVLLIILAVLGGLGYVLWTQFKTKPSPAKTASATPSLAPAVTSPSVSLSPTKSASTASSSATLEAKKMSIQILNGSGVAGQADQVKSDFTKKGFTNVTTGNASGVTLSKTSVVFKKEIASPLREEIAEILKARFPDISVQETTESEFDVSITTVRIVTPTPTP